MKLGPLLRASRTVFRAEVQSATASVLSVLGVVLLLAGGHWLVQILGALAWVGGLVLVARHFQRLKIRRRPYLVAYVGQRLVLVVGAGAAYLARRPDDAVWIWSTTGLLLLCVLGESPLRALLGRAEPLASGLPGVPELTDPPYPPHGVIVATFGATAVGGILAAIGPPAWVFLVVVLATSGVVGVMIAYAARSVLGSSRAERKLRPALDAYAPEFAVYYATAQGATYQLGMWLPYLHRLNRRFIVITRHASTVQEIRRLTEAPIVVPRPNSAKATLASCVVGSLKACYYVQGHPGNLHMIRFRRVTHIWLNHGDSDKSANFSAQHANYDKVFVSGQQGVERYAAHGVTIRPDQFEVVGRPQIERIQTRDEPLPEGAPRTVFYAPTWIGGRATTNYSSLHLGPQLVTALLERGCTVIFRPHPHSRRHPGHSALIAEIGRMLEADQRATKRQHVWGRQAETEWDIPECFNHSDALVTDVSSVASDFLATGKPFAMVAIQQSGAAFTKEIPMARVAYVIESDLSTLASALDNLLGPDPIREARLVYRTHCLGNALGARAPEGFLATSARILDTPR